MYWSPLLVGWHVSSSHSFIYFFLQVFVKWHYVQNIGQGAEFAACIKETKRNKAPQGRYDNKRNEKNFFQTKFDGIWKVNNAF